MKTIQASTTSSFPVTSMLEHKQVSACLDFDLLKACQETLQGILKLDPQSLDPVGVSQSLGQPA